MTELTTWACVFVLASIGLAQAQDTYLSGAEFDAYTAGKTLNYMREGITYGAEQYLPDRQVVWAFEGDECIKGFWYEPEPTLICFSYEGGENGPQCWKFSLGNGGLHAVLDMAEPATELYETQQSPKPLFCPGPQVGA